MNRQDHLHQQNEPARSAWREPMVWLVATIPLLAVVATTGLLAVAWRSSGNVDAVADTVRRTAQVQDTDLGPDDRARQLRLSAVVRIGKDAIEVLPVEGAFDRGRPLSLALHHPTHAGEDRRFLLAPSEDGWLAPGGLDLTHDWNAELGSTAGRWRLQGRWRSGQQAAYLRPALPE
ncbi:FixH family protein [Agrilutibacter solisilvae]|uniref:FixH family protein n=1 Tax=Agrilutibacter solisilvae TaxID=2763317 RepID=A0A974XXJ3_9GAMM|nr:FixH family protein [Lysobacter solisilvae]QSX77651.1 FixH family protein [Lysobacter solisilvae]